MKNYALILFSTLFIVEILTYIVHQVVMQEPYMRAYVLIPVFFILSEGILVWLTTIKWSQKLENIWFLSYKTIKFLLTILLIGFTLFALPEIGIAFYFRLFTTYFVFLIIETIIGVQITKNGTKQ